ncbi:PIN domain-containing protein [Candidatus Methylomirabilis limnetica]|nr:PIN domain-containing protein [Candidatus Methylomirabilis limnetica]
MTTHRARPVTGSGTRGIRCNDLPVTPVSKTNHPHFSVEIPPVTSNYILVETFALLQNRLGMEAARAFQDDILPLINIEFIASGTHRSGVAALLSASRRDLSIVDCVSFEVMRTSGINTVFAFDKHFKEQGFTNIA